MTRCKYCHTDHELDSKGRCPSCADAGDATRAGMHYGAYMARKYAGQLPPTPEARRGRCGAVGGQIKRSGAGAGRSIRRCGASTMSAIPAKAA